MSQARTINVPGTFKSIQKALNRAKKGDTIKVNEGIYHETIQWPSTYGIQLIGHAGKTIIDAQEKGSVIYFSSDLKGLVDHKTIIQGFILKNGKPGLSTLYGGGIYCHSVSPYLEKLIIRDNQACKGGGLFCFQSNVFLTNVTFVNNYAKSGGGIACEFSKPELKNVTVSENYANSGAALYAMLSTLKLKNVSILNNTALLFKSYCSAIYLNNSNLILDYSLVWNIGTRQEIYFSKFDQQNSLTIDNSTIREERQLIMTNNNGDIKEVEIDDAAVAPNINQSTNQPINKPQASSLYLSPQSDTGIDSTDNITNKSNIQLLAKGVNGNCLNIYEKNTTPQKNQWDPFDQEPLARACFSNDVLSTEILLSEGVHTVFVHPIINNLYTISKMPSPITITVDQTAPVIKELSTSYSPAKERMWTFISQDSDPKLQYEYCIYLEETSEPCQDYSKTQSSTIKIPDLTDGKYFVHVKAIDQAGNESSEYSFTRIIDNTAPVVIIKAIKKDRLTQQWTWTSPCLESGLESGLESESNQESDILYRYIVDRNPSVTPTGVFNSITSTTLSNVNGMWYIHVQAKDGFGNLSQVTTSSVFIDNIPPKLKGLSDDPVPKKEKIWKWQSDEAEVTYRFKINNQSEFDLTESFKKINQAKIFYTDGQYYIHIEETSVEDTSGSMGEALSLFCNFAPVSNKDEKLFLHVQAKDKAGNVSEPVTVFCILDNTKPVITGLSDDSVPTQSKIWNWSATDSDSMLLFKFVINQEQKSELSGGEFSNTTTASLKDKNGIWYLHVQAKDRSENLSEIVTVSTTMDNTPPLLEGLKDDPEPKQWKEWTWKSNEPESFYRYEINKKSNVLSIDMPFTSENSAKISDGNGRLYLHVQAKDLAGNISNVVTVSAVLDNESPELTNLSDDPVPRQMKTWVWGSNKPGTTYRYQIDNQIDNQLETVLKTSFSDTNFASISNKDGKFFLHVQAKDKAGNIGKPLTVFCILDNTKPVITGLSDDPVPTQTKTWNWSATDADPILRYRFLIDQNKKAGLLEKFTEVNTASIKGQNGIWYFHIQAQDRAGNMSDIKTVSKLLDNTPPVLTIKPPDSSKRTIWTWSANDLNPPIEYSYRCDRNNDFHPENYSSETSFDPIDCIFNAPKESRQLKDLNARWYFHIQARDQALNTTTQTKKFNFDFLKEGLYANLNIMFKSNSSQMQTNSLGKLYNLSKIMLKYPDAIALIKAHTDSRGDDAYNLQLSEKRAEAIRKYLNEKLNIPIDRLTCKGYGETMPIADNETDDGRKQNRRAEVFLKAK